MNNPVAFVAGLFYLGLAVGCASGRVKLRPWVSTFMAFMLAMLFFDMALT